jgi:hypothetical protein
MSRWAGACVLAAVGIFVPIGTAVLAQDLCAVPEYITHVDGKLPHLSTLAKDHRLDVLVVGTGSSMLGGQEGAKTAYPARLEDFLKASLPGVAVTVRADVKSRRSTADMAQALSNLPTDGKPGLVVWQAGTVDAMRGIDPDEFRFALEKGVKKLQTAGIDVVLMNMQYSPRTEAMIVVGPYADAMRFVAQQNDIPLFDRSSAMKHWSEAGVFDLSGAADRSQVAERVHDCIGKVLARMILESAGLDRTQPKENR